MDILTNPQTNYGHLNAPQVNVQSFYPIELDTKRLLYNLIEYVYFPSLPNEVISTTLENIPGLNLEFEPYKEKIDEPKQLYECLSKSICNTKQIINKILDSSEEIRETTGQLSQEDKINKSNQQLGKSIVCDVKNTRLILYNTLPEIAIILRSFIGMGNKNTDLLEYKDNFYNQISNFYNASDSLRNSYTISSLMETFGIYRLIATLDLPANSDILNYNSNYFLTILMEIDGRIEGVYERRILNNQILNNVINVCYYNISANKINFYWSISSYDGSNNFIYSTNIGDEIVYIGEKKYIKTKIENNLNGNIIRIHNQTLQYLSDYKIINEGEFINILVELKDPSYIMKNLVFYTLPLDVKLSLKVQMFPLNKMHGSSISSCVYDSIGAPGDFLNSVEINSTTGEH